MYELHKSDSGSFQELAHASDVKFGQLSLLKINVGCWRGNHYHMRKEEWFCCIKGKCLMELLNLNGSRPSNNIVLNEDKSEFIYVRPYEVHRINNIGENQCELLVIVSEVFDQKDTDTYEFTGDIAE